MSIVLLSIITFWSSFLIGILMTAMILPMLRRMRAYKRSDRKQTLYGTEAVEFRKIREQEEKGGKKNPVPRMGGLVLLPTVILVGGTLAYYLTSPLLFIIIMTITAVVLAMLYDDLIDIGIIKRSSFRIRLRLFLFAVIIFICAVALVPFLPNTITLLPFQLFENLSVVPIGMAVLFTLWCLFWQTSSIIDGVDGLSGTVFLVLFAGCTVVSIIQGNGIVLLISLMSIGMLIPWLFANYAPAKAYLTETGITTLLLLFAISTFLLAVGGGAGIWIAFIFGAVLIATWMSNVLQLLYRKKTGKKLFRIAPLHHHFEAIGIPSSSIVLRYMLVSIICFMLGMSLLLIV